MATVGVRNTRLSWKSPEHSAELEKPGRPTPIDFGP